MSELVRGRRSGAVAVIELDRPERRHAMNTPLLEALLAALSGSAGDPAVAAVVIAGSEGCFSSGADISEDLDHDGAVRRMGLFARLFETVAGFPKPTVAAIDGWCVGGGAEVASGCDLRVGTPGASIRFPEAIYGVPGGAARLPALVGLSHAKDLLLTARVVGGEEAYRIGWLNRLVPPDQLAPTAEQLAGEMAGHRGTAALKRILDEAAGISSRTRQENRALIRFQDEATGLMG
ncbi:MAG TPA: enoyl-CoA hydratase/isomerase family protein [Actinomycetota bacterium]|nr:enoyl-CoA hydratase/isomerase family protein [Actinomycetota bacterium]